MCCFTSEIYSFLETVYHTAKTFSLYLTHTHNANELGKTALLWLTMPQLEYKECKLQRIECRLRRF